MVTVALDTDVEAARPFHAAVAPTHPSLGDPAHRMVELFGITNVPFALWIDETGTIVRPAEVAFGPMRADARPGVSENHTADARRMIDAMMANVDHTGRYAAAVRDWVANGAASPWVLRPEEVVERSRPRSPEAAMAAAEFEIAQHLHRAGHGRDAVAHFLRAHELDPTNWSYIREALSLADPEWGPVYPRNLLAEVEAVGVETFYPSLDM